jgi:chemotaxis protein MotB
MAILPEESASEGAPEWMVSYADMITILMSFFAMMFSMAMSKEAKNNVPMMKSLQRQFGAVPTTFRRSFGAERAPEFGANGIQQIESQDQGRVGYFSQARTKPFGDEATIGGVIYFNPGTSRLDEEQRRQLQNLAKALGGKSVKVEILAHSFGQPRDADDKLAANWKLARARNNNMLRYLETLGIDPQRIRTGIAAQCEPSRAGGDTLLLGTDDSVEVFTLDKFAENARAESTGHVRD